MSTQLGDPPRVFNPNRLVAARRRLGWSRHDLAHAAGVLDHSVGRWESGRFSPSLANAIRLADALGLPVDDLLTGTGRT